MVSVLRSLSLFKTAFRGIMRLEGFSSPPLAPWSASAALAALLGALFILQGATHGGKRQRCRRDGALVYLVYLVYLGKFSKTRKPVGITDVFGFFRKFKWLAGVGQVVGRSGSSG